MLSEHKNGPQPECRIRLPALKFLYCNTASTVGNTPTGDYWYGYKDHSLQCLIRRKEIVQLKVAHLPFLMIFTSTSPCSSMVNRPSLTNTSVVEPKPSERGRRRFLPNGSDSDPGEQLDLLTSRTRRDHVKQLALSL